MHTIKTIDKNALSLVKQSRHPPTSFRSAANHCY